MQKENKNMRTIELITFAECDENTYNAIQKEYGDSAWAKTLPVELIAKLQDRRTKVFERDKDDLLFVNKKEEEQKKLIESQAEKIRQLEKQLEIAGQTGTWTTEWAPKTEKQEN